MNNYHINIVLNDKVMPIIENIGLSDHIVDIQSTKIIPIEMSSKDHKKLMKAFCDLTFDENNACVLPKEKNEILINLIIQSQSIDIMKTAIMKLYNPLAGRDIFGRGTGCR
ncbi:hypothetical protein SAMN05421830_112122 [Desulfomicrobium norvegicum]|uniref:Uncharacterized protein n=1 Tax=Desulfomicrobium norvegicum (strain DSM 1741 / NCIMB 8310) TaxID=52561 RepID=A0A8G2FFI0_DESNO|nr:hypothetical protein [Desulfomicrobium norvegicum]SFM05303.1 hypothetical protein SAMN05421830_112122 [Desulfomicrobium norvegicum]